MYVTALDISYSFQLMLYSTYRASPVTPQRPSREGFFAYKAFLRQEFMARISHSVPLTVFPRRASKCQPSTSEESSNFVEIFLGTGWNFFFGGGGGDVGLLFSNIVFTFLQRIADCSHKLCHSLSSRNDNCVVSVWGSRRL